MFKLSSEACLDGAVTVENKFIVEYMPYADGDYVKVYLYGLSLAARKDDPDDTVERMARRLDLDEATVSAAIDYWTELGLMSRLGDDISYLSPRTARPKIKKYDVDKYREFNRQAQSYITSRQISPNEYNEYYGIMERLGIEWLAMVLIVKYCVDLKGENVSCPYILAVARNLAQDGYRTADEVEERLEEYGVYYNDLCEVLGALGGGKRPDHESVKLYKKWKIVYKYDKDMIVGVAATIKRGGMATLDTKLTQYSELGFATAEQIQKYEDERKALYKLTKAVNKALGVYYENVDPEITNYIRPWLDMGFEDGAVVAVAEYCMKNGLKTLSDLDSVMREFFNSSVLTEKQVKAHTEREARFDGDISALMQSLKLRGAIKPVYRAFYENWRERMNVSKELIDHAATLAADKSNPFAYMNSVLSAWSASGVTTVDGAKAHGTEKPSAPTGEAKPNTVREQMTAEQLNALFVRLGEEDK